MLSLPLNFGGTISDKYKGAFYFKAPIITMENKEALEPKLIVLKLLGS